jgi:hypothetical protein
MIKSLHGVVAVRTPLTNNVTDVRIFSTHAGNGSTSQYADYPANTTEFDKLFDVNNSNTSLSWSGGLSGSVSLNWNIYTTLTGAGATVPNSGSYFSVEVTFTFVPKETGTYSFSIDSDDGSDLSIDGNMVATYYGGHGTGQGSGTGTYDVVAGERYTLVARAQEYGGGEGMIVKLQRPSQGSVSLQTSEVFQPN